MSRHILTPRPDQPEIVAIVVGWDRPLQTFFAQVFARTEAEPDEGEATIWSEPSPANSQRPRPRSLSSPSSPTCRTRWRRCLMQRCEQAAIPPMAPCSPK